MTNHLKQWASRALKRKPNSNSKSIEPLAPAEAATTPSSPTMGEDSDTSAMFRRRLMTVKGRVGTGKTVLIRALMEQWRNHPTYVFHLGDTLDNVEPWVGLMNFDILNAREGHGDLPEPPKMDDLPSGSLVVFDISLDLARQGEGPDVLKSRLAPTKVNSERFDQWVEFYTDLPRRMRSLGVTLFISDQRIGREDEGLPSKAIWGEVDRRLWDDSLMVEAGTPRLGMYRAHRRTATGDEVVEFSLADLAPKREVEA